MKRHSLSESRQDDHLRLLEALNARPLDDSCCEICHCECYNSHRSIDLSVERAIQLESSRARFDSNNNNNSASKAKKPEPKQAKIKDAKKKKKKSASVGKSVTPVARRRSSLTEPTSRTTLQRTKSANSLYTSHKQLAAEPPIAVYCMRDCKVLQDLLGSLEATPRLEIAGHSKSKSPNPTTTTSKNTTTTTLPSITGGRAASLCESMAELCLAPDVRAAYRQVPVHDQKILNRMATKRTETLLAKENAWLARKFWENERYERELLKCAQMEEYKRAIRDKQFQDYMLTKARLDELAQRDLDELHRLRASLQQKDDRTRRRLDTLRIEREMQMCQRRCDELRRSEAVNVQQEEHQLDVALRKHELCHRLGDRLQRADQQRTQTLDTHLRRLRYDNYIAQLAHEEKWRQAQELELRKREQLKEHISRKRTRSEHFVETRLRRNEALTKTAKISASLRELVRSSVTPEAALTAGCRGAVAVPVALTRMLHEKPISRLAIQ